MFITCFAPLISPYNPLNINIQEKLQGISTQHIMGTDQLGRDSFSRVLYGARVSITASFSVVCICFVTGVIVGCTAGYLGDMVDELLMRLVDMMMAFPSIILPITIAGILGPSVKNIVLALALTSWVGYARMVRGSVLMLKNLPLIEAAKAMGSSQWQIIKENIIPDAIHPLIVYAAFNASHTILAISGLGFLGLGAQPPTLEWGSMLFENRILHKSRYSKSCRRY